MRALRHVGKRGSEDLGDPPARLDVERPRLLEVLVERARSHAEALEHVIARTEDRPLAFDETNRRPAHDLVADVRGTKSLVDTLRLLQPGRDDASAVTAADVRTTCSASQLRDDLALTVSSGTPARRGRELR